MVRNRLIYIILLLFINFQLLYSQEDVSKLRQIVRADGQAEVTIAFPGTRETEYIGRNVSIASVKDKRLYLILTGRTVEWFIAQKYSFTIIERVPSKGLTSPETIAQAMQWDTYPSYTQYISIMESFASDYPGLCRIDTIGTSIQGKLVLALKISDNVSDDEEDEPEVFYTSSMHGNETGGYILMLHLADYLLKNYSTDSRVKRLVNNLEIWINPLANPDGTYRNSNTITNPVRANSHDTDLNRNFPDPAEPGKVVEKENIDMIRFMRGRHFVLSANFHSGSELVNYPWDSREQLHADNSWFYLISRRYADTAQYYSDPAFYMRDHDGVIRGIQWYKINGGRMDFVTYALHGREVTIELDNDFITPAAELASLWEYNYRSLLGYLENALYGIHGRVTDAFTSKPVAARIFILAHDIDSSQVYSDTLTGSFVRMLSQGSWDLWITARGYRDTLVKNILVQDAREIILNIKLRASANPPVQGNSPLIYPNPASSILRMMMPLNLTGKVKITIFNQTGMKISEYYTMAILGIPLEHDVSSLAAGVYNVKIINILTGASGTGRFVVVRK